MLVRLAQAKDSVLNEIRRGTLFLPPPVREYIVEFYGIARSS